MGTLAFTILGLPEWWTGFVFGVVAVVVIVPTWFVLSEEISARRSREPADWRDGLSHPDGQAGAGIVLADYVDEKTLASIAKQKEIEPEPTRRERGWASKRGGNVGGQFRFLQGGLSRERQE